MKTFNKEITVQLSVDAIAEQLLSIIKDDYKHRDLVVETIVGRLLATDDSAALGMLNSSLNGHQQKINFEIGDIVSTDITELGNWDGSSKKTREAIGTAKVIDIDVYAVNKLMIEYSVPDNSAPSGFKTVKVPTNHRNCSKVPPITEITEAQSNSFAMQA